MKEKIDLALKIKERVLYRNLLIYSFEKLPQEVLNNLSYWKNQFLLLKEQNFYKVSLEILNSKELLIKKEGGLPPFQNGELVLLILPFSKVRYIFKTKIKEEKEGGYLAEILDPRYEERIPIKTHLPVFFSYIPEKYVQKLLQQAEYHLLRETNFTVEAYPTLNEVYLYDLVITPSHSIDEEFKKLIQKTFLVGELVNLSKGGLCARAQGEIKILDEFGVFYLKFNIITFSKTLKFALFTHLRDVTFREGYTYFHFAQLVELRKEFWDLIKEDLLKLGS